jgi:hypothetical protein
VDICIENAKRQAIRCTAEALPSYNPWSNVRKMVRYYQCLGQLREDLLECDRRAKRDTNCPDVNTPPDCRHLIAQPAGKTEVRRTGHSVERFLDSLSTPLKPGSEDERIA